MFDWRVYCERWVIKEEEVVVILRCSGGGTKYTAVLSLLVTTLRFFRT